MGRSNNMAMRFVRHSHCVRPSGAYIHDQSFARIFTTRTSNGDNSNILHGQHTSPMKKVNGSYAIVMIVLIEVSLRS